MNVSKKLVVTSILITLIFCSVLSVRNGITQLGVAEYSVYFSDWENEIKREDKEIIWSEGLKFLLILRNISPKNSQISSLIGRHYEWKAMISGDDRNRRNHLLLMSLENYRLASQLNPVDAYNWANLIGVKLKVNQLDREFEQGIVNTSVLGAWEPQVQLKVTEIGLTSWNNISPKTRLNVLNSAKRAMQMTPDEILGLAKAHKKIRHLCLIAPNSFRKKTRECEQV